MQPKQADTCVLMTDKGHENYGTVKDFLKTTTNPSISHIIAQVDIEFSNSMIEAANKNIKYRFLYHKHIPDFETLCRYLPQAIDDYNNRPHDVLNGLTPLEVLNGKTIDKTTLKLEMAAAKINRTAENKKTKCCQFSF